MSQFIMHCRVLLATSVLLSTSTFAQSDTARGSQQELSDLVMTMQKQIHELQAAVVELRHESEAYRHETEELRQELAARSSEPTYTIHPGEDCGANQGQRIQPDSQGQAVPSEGRLSLDDEVRLLAGKVNDQYQTKVESGSKYRVRLSGMILLNAFENRGTVDSIDMPALAEPRPPLFGNGAFGGTVRQSQIGIEVFGPNWAGARVSGDLRFDFAGGFPDTSNGVTLGLMRLRTGGVRLDWKDTSVFAGQDSPLTSPLSPTSLAQVAEPEFSYAGNLWTWTPQIRVEHRIHIGDRQQFVVEAGLLDSLTGYMQTSQTDRVPHAGETSRQPAYASRIGFARGEGDNALTIGAGGYYGRQDWGFNRNVDSWAATADWNVPITSKFAISGEFYRGRGIGGLGGATGHSVLSNGVLYSSSSRVEGLNVIGGWAQLKFRATSTLQFNAAYGIDDPYAGQLRRFSAVQNLLDPELGKNRAFMTNFIYRPKSNLLFSTEYRHLDSTRFNESHFSAEHVNLSVGVLF